MFAKLIIEHGYIVTIGLSGLICGIVALVWEFRFKDREIQQFFWSNRLLVICLLILLIIMIPFAGSRLITNSTFSYVIFGFYLRELSMSVLLVLTFALGWFLSEKFSRWYRYTSLRELFKPFQDDGNDSIRKARVTLEDSERLVGQLGSVLSAWDDGVIDQDDAILVQEISSLERWLVEGDITGFYDLREKVLFGKGLHSSTKTIIGRELEQLNAKDSSNGYYEKQRDLRFLLFPQSDTVTIDWNDPEFDEVLRQNLILFEEPKRSQIEKNIKMKNLSLQDIRSDQWVQALA